jgi:predicted nicotinamide N-methyase
MVNPKATFIDLSINGRDFTLTQSPGLLQSNREGGTTGAAVWATSVRFAQWISSSDNILFKDGVLSASSNVLELGSGISGLVGCVLASRVQRVILTDQQYTLKLLKDNVNANVSADTGKGKTRTKRTNQDHSGTNVAVESLDWETDAIAPFLTANGLTTGADVVLACDCIYNYALIEPFTQACADICRVRQQSSELDESKPTVCVVAQHLRQPDVFEEWAEVFMRKFHIWRIPSEMLGEALGEGSGFAVHVALLKVA